MSSKAEKGAPISRHVLEIAGNAITGGMEKYVYNLALHLPGHGFKVTCLAPYESPFTASLRQLGCEVFVTPMGEDLAWRSLQFTVELIRHSQVDLIHAHMPRAHLLGGVAGRLANVPVVATVHGMEVNAQELGIARIAQSQLVAVCQAAYSQALALGVDSGRLALISNGVDLHLFSPGRGGAAFRKALNVPPDAPLVGFVGRLAIEKGPDQWIRMAEYVHRRRPEVHFVMVGDGPLAEEVAKLARSARLEDRLHRTGLLSEIWQVYDALDVLAQASRVEGMPFALLEAMACGTPVAAMAVGGVAEIIEVSTTGFLSASGDWAGLGEAVIQMLANPEMRLQMGQAARRRAEESFDLRQSVRALAGLFRRLLGEEPLPEELLGQGWPVRESERPAHLPTETGQFKRK